MAGAVTQHLISSSSEVQPDLGQRLQQVVLRWRGADRGQSLADLHEECRACVGPGGQRLLPERLVLVPDLDAASLKRQLTRRRLLRSDADPRFRGKTAGRFDAALVPAGTAGQAADRWLLFIEESLPPRDQLGLYAIAVAYGLLNREAQRMGRPALLDPRDGFTHRLLLSELRLLENARQDRDRRVLEAYPLLADLLRPPEELTAATSPADPALLQRLGQAGWRGPLLNSPYVYTAGRIYVGNSGLHRGRRLRVDALLRAEASLPIALVHSVRHGEEEKEAEARLAEITRERLGLPFAYLVRRDGSLAELDWTRNAEPQVTSLSEFPTAEDLLDRWLDVLGLNDDEARTVLRYPYDIRAGQTPRYYQESAINRAVIAVLQARRNRRSSHILLNLATGTGKTKVAFQIAWKLKRGRAVGNILFLTDRDYLLTQAMDNEFAPFRDARARIRGELKTAQDIFFSTYQALAGAEGRAALYRRYPRDYFSLVIVDECHRGSAQDDSNWRDILKHFGSAVQIGMTATPLRTDNVDTYSYFGDPVATYSLRRGINDGFLAPYRVRRVLMKSVPELEQGEGKPPETLVLSETERGEAEARMESATNMVRRTTAIAEHLARHLRTTDPTAKTIVFCVDQDHAEQMRQALEVACPAEVERFKQRGESYVERIVAEEGNEGKRALGRFSDPEQTTPVLVTTSKLLSTGVDIPTCKNIAIARPVGSIVEFKQIIGRGTRLLEPQKTWFAIIDYAGATNHFYDPEFDGDPEFVDLEELMPEAGSSPAKEVAPAREAVAGGAEPTAVQSAVTADASTALPPGATVLAGGSTTAGQTVQPDGGGTSVSAGAATTTGGEGPGGPTPPGELSGAIGATSADTSKAGTGEPPSATGTVSPPGPPVAGSSTPDEPVQSEGTGAATTAAGTTLPQPLIQPGAEQRTRPRDGSRIAIVGEIVYELGPDGRTLREIPYFEYAREALGDHCPSVDSLRQRWLHPEQRAELEGLLADAGVELPELAAALDLADRDAVDVLAGAIFKQTVPTRQERVERLRREHSDWLDGFTPPAREILEAVLEKYVAGEAAHITDTGLLKVPPLAERGTFMELAQHFGGGAALRAALEELQSRLYAP